MKQKLINLIQKYKWVIISVVVIIATVFVVKKIEQWKFKKINTRIDNLIQDSINTHIYRDSLEVEYKVLQRKIDENKRLDSLRVQEYAKLLNHNSLLTRDSLRRLFTGS